MTEEQKSAGVEVEAKSATAQITFEELNSRDLHLEPVSDHNGMVRPRDVRMVFGKRVRVKAGQPTQISGWWKAYITTVFDGMEKELEGSGAKPQQAIASVLRSLPGTVVLDQYVEPDWADEFYSQKIAAPAKPAITWDEKLQELRTTIEAAFEQQDDAHITALDSALNIGDMLCAVRKDYKLTNADLVKFVQGEGLGDNARNMPKLVKLIRGGPTAVAEAASFGELHDKLRNVLLYDGGTSGKALSVLKSEATKAMVEAGVERYMAEVAAEAGDREPKYLPVVLDGSPAFDAGSAARLLRHIVKSPAGYNVSNALNDAELPFAELVVAADAAADEIGRKFREDGGRFFSMYNKEDKERVVHVFGVTLHAYSGSEFNMAHGVALAADFIQRQAVKEHVGDIKPIADGMKMLNSKKMNPLIGLAREVILRSLEADKKNQEAKRHEKQIDEVIAREVGGADEGDGVVKKGARKTFASLSVEEATMKLFSLLSSHSEHAQIVKSLGLIYDRFALQKGAADGADGAVKEAAE